eukprot:NODE_1697_length_1844_cov_47.674027_g1439_i0.p1 GENE.NODE_1697_length_1844_cov_47.674027_g1439_i0~~NODE_1697_length_1844_cov_47.674027_g1439_i0.p1  ORF type:complete len:482 (+),score=82.55 NODE_1697_length_1844_cov_47.674027_g1439_i0:71-1516(+)
MTDRDCEYLRGSGVPLILEEMLGQLLEDRPLRPIPFMMKYLSERAKIPSAKDRLSQADIDAKLSRIHHTFIGIPIHRVDGSIYAAFTITDFNPPMRPELMEDIADCMTFSHHKMFERCDCIVAIATRGAGPLAHACALRMGKPYSLCNWYPEGSVGDIMVESSPGFSGNGCIYLNSVWAGAKVVVVDDILRTGKTSYTVLEAVKKSGAETIGCVFVAEACNLGGRQMLEKIPNMSVHSLVLFHATGTHTTADPTAPPTPPPSPHPSRQGFSFPTLTASELQPKLERVKRAFVGVPIQPNPKSGYPYSNFTLTDFVPMLLPDLVEDMADCCVSMAPFTDADIIVSESDRGGGPLTHACAMRTNQPYCLANWYAPNTELSSGAKANVGYSGEGNIYVSGLSPGMKVIVVDDMLSSGGTAEALFQCIQQAGGILVGAVFASEKVNTKGRTRLAKSFPNVPLISLCYFSSVGTETIEASHKDTLI